MSLAPLSSPSAGVRLAPRSRARGWPGRRPVFSGAVPPRSRSRSRVRASSPSDSDAATPPPSPDTSTLRAELFALLGSGGSGESRMARLADRARLESLVESLEASNPTPRPFESPDLLLNEWKLVTTFKPGVADVRFDSLRSWREYLFGSGPSPVQSLVVGNSTVDNVFQTLEDPRAPRGESKWENVVEFGPPGTRLVIEAAMEGLKDDRAFYYRFTGGYFAIDGAWGGPDGIRVPYPVPFDALERARPGQTKGWFETTYLDDELRISRGNKGSVFVLKRPEGYWEKQRRNAA